MGNLSVCPAGTTLSNFHLHHLQVQQHQFNELILYTCAQFAGAETFTLVSRAFSTPEQAHTLNAVYSAFLTSMRGGGGMDITSTLRSP